MRDDDLQFVITTKDQTEPIIVPFEKLFALQSKITSMTFLWTTNSYFVNVSEYFFIINGGRKIHMKAFKDAKNVQILYCKRNSVTMNMNNVDNGKGNHEVSFILGLEGMLGNEKREVMIHISPDGREWYWRNHR